MWGENGFIDGIDTPNTLESARIISKFANDAKGLDDQRVPEINSDLSTLLGQIWTHEMIQTKKSQLPDKQKNGFNCCNPKNDPTLADLIKINTYCLPIEVAADDSCYKNQKKRLNYIKPFKSLNNCLLDETPMPRNFHTSFYDCELIFNPLSLKHLEENKGMFDFANDDKMIEILAGFDERSQQLPGLLLILSIFIRFYNIVFGILCKRFKPPLTPEQISAMSFLARQITTAAYQKVFSDYSQSILRKILTSDLTDFPNVSPS